MIETYNRLVRLKGGQDSQTAGKALQLLLPSRHGNVIGGRVNSPGYGNNARDWLIRNQASRKGGRLND